MGKIFEFKYVKELFTLALPIIMGNIGHILLGAVDCFVAGRYSTDAVAAISIATAIHVTLVMFGIGLTVSISPLLSNKRGAKEETKKYFLPTLKFALSMGIVLMCITLGYIPFLKYLGYEANLLHNIEVFTFILAFSCIGAEINVAIKEFLQSYEIVFLPNFLLVLSVFLDLILNYAFVYGLYGCPKMGVAGIALSTTLIRTLIALILLLFCFFKFRFKNFKDHDYYKQIFRMGLPISAAIIIEFTAFNYIAIILGRVSGVYAAAHNIILVLSSTSFMVPMGLSNALAVKVGYANGAHNYAELLKYIKNGIGCSMAFMAFAAAIFAIFPVQLAKLFTTDPILIKTIVPVMFIVAAFQITDGMQTSLSGIFKGLKNTKFVMIANLISYLIIGVSLGTYLGIIKKMYLSGCWFAIAISSIILTSIMLIGLRRKLKQLKGLYLK